MMIEANLSEAMTRSVSVNFIVLYAVRTAIAKRRGGRGWASEPSRCTGGGAVANSSVLYNSMLITSI